jgi:hypothetical protein
MHYVLMRRSLSSKCSNVSFIYRSGCADTRDTIALDSRSLIQIIQEGVENSQEVLMGVFLLAEAGLYIAVPVCGPRESWTPISNFPQQHHHGLFGWLPIPHPRQQLPDCF